MKKQNFNKHSDLPLNHYITVDFRRYFNMVSTTHEAGSLCCAQMKAHILEPVNWLLYNWACNWKNKHLDKYFYFLISV